MIATPTSVSGRPPVIRRRRPVVVLAITTGAVSLLVVPLLSVLGIHLSTDTVAGFKTAAKVVRELYGLTPAAGFGPAELKRVRRG